MRPHDWQARLAAFIESRRDLPFAWGTNDCVAFAHAWAAEAGVEVALPVWTSARDAALLLKEASIEERADELMERVPVPFARRGDLVLVETGGRDSLAVCNGENAVGPGEHGLVFVPMAAARAAWRV